MNSRTMLSKRAPTQKKILDAIEEAGEPVSPKDISDATGINEGTVRSTVRKMEEKGLIYRPYDYGVYASVSSKDLHQIQKNSHTEPIQSDTGLSGGSDEIVDDTSTTKERGGHMELPRGGSLRKLNVPQYFDIWMLGEVIATVEFARIIPGKRKSVDITRAALDMRYSPHDYHEIEEGSPVNDDG